MKGAKPETEEPTPPPQASPRECEIDGKPIPEGYEFFCSPGCHEIYVRGWE